MASSVSPNCSVERMLDLDQRAQFLGGSSIRKPLRQLVVERGRQPFLQEWLTLGPRGQVQRMHEFVLVEKSGGVNLDLVSMAFGAAQAAITTLPREIPVNVVVCDREYLTFRNTERLGDRAHPAFGLGDSARADLGIRGIGEKLTLHLDRRQLFSTLRSTS